jgi:hypothetical protein
MNKNNWKPVVEILVDEDRGLVASRVVQSFDATPSKIAGMLISMLDMFVSKVSEQDQAEFEQTIVTIFNEGLEERFKYLDKEKYGDS